MCRVDAVTRQQDVTIDDQVGRWKAEPAADAITGHDVADDDRRPSEQLGGSRDVAGGEEGSDPRAGHRRAGDDQRRHDGDGAAVTGSELPQQLRIAGAIGSEAKRRTDDDGASVQLLGEHGVGEVGWGKMAQPSERGGEHLIDRAKEDPAFGRLGQEEYPSQRRSLGCPRWHREGVHKGRNRQSIGLPTELGQDRSVAEVHAVEGTDADRRRARRLHVSDGIRLPGLGQGMGDRVGAAQGDRYNRDMRSERIAGARLEEEEGALLTLRPHALDAYINQREIKEKLRIYIAAAKNRDESLDHVLLHGPPGLGKTTLAQIIAAEMGVDIRISSGPAIEKAGDLAAILTNLKPHDVFFIDEIHRLRRNVEEILYPAMEDYKIDIVLGEGPNAQSLRIDVPPFTLVGATTRAGLISAPMRDRFEVKFRVGFYAVEDLRTIVVRTGHIFGIEVTDGGAEEIAKRARGTPRIANRLLRRTRDFAEVEGRGTIDVEIARRSLEMLRIDERGLDELDRAVLMALVDTFSGGPVGLDTLAAALSEEKDTITDIVEPFLLQEGLIQRTPQGRIATERALAYWGQCKDGRLF